MASKKGKTGILTRWRQGRLKRLKARMEHKEKELQLRSAVQKSSSSLFWVWEFSKKAVLICFVFYVIVQVYAMVVMLKFCDFAYLGELIGQTGEITRDCVFAYLIKAGLENIGKIWFRNTEWDKAKKCNEIDSGENGITYDVTGDEINDSVSDEMNDSGGAVG